MYNIGLYAHYHGSGHASYANQIAKCNPEQFVVLTSADYDFESSVNVLTLPYEDLTGKEVTSKFAKQPEFLHHNPQGNKDVLVRSALILDQLVKSRIDLLLVDVSVEIAMLARVASVPYAYCRMLGDRNDQGHIIAYQGAQFLYAFYPESIELDITPKWIREKTIYLGFIASTTTVQKFQPLPVEPTSILVLQGKGGSDFNQKMLLQLERQFPKSNITLIGKYPEKIQDSSQSKCLGFVDNPAEFIKSHDLVISSCGSNTVSLLLSLGRQFVAIPESRPYDEQKIFAEQLQKEGICWVVESSNIRKAYNCFSNNQTIKINKFKTSTARSFSNALVRNGIDTINTFKVKAND